MMRISCRKTIVLLLLAIMASTDFCDGAEESLAFLRSSREFELMAQMYRLNPDLLDSVLERMTQSNPILLQAIAENEEEFYRMLNENASAPASVEEMTSQDRDAIERLKSMGFSEDEVVEVYFLLDKDETLARDFLSQIDN